MTDAPKKTHWLLTKTGVVVGLTLVGPLALVLVWKSPELTRKGKIVMTVITLILAAVMMSVMPRVLTELEARLSALGAL